MEKLTSSQQAMLVSAFKQGWDRCRWRNDVCDWCMDEHAYQEELEQFLKEISNANE